MATFYGVNKTKIDINNPSDKVEAKEHSGKERFAYDAYVFLANAFAANDEIEVMKLPKGAKIVNAVVKSPSLGTTGIFDLGIRSNGVEAADQDYLVLAADAGGQAVVQQARSGVGVAGLFATLSAETQVVLKCTEVTTAAIGLKIEVAVEYVVE